MSRRVLDVQFDLYPSLFLSGVDGGLLLSFRTGFDGIAVSIVPYNCGDLGIPCLVFLSGEPALRDNVSPRVSTRTDGGGGRMQGVAYSETEVWRGRNTRRVPGNFVYLWDLARLQNRVGHARECSSDVESDDEGLFVARVGFAGYPRLLHGG